MPRLVLICALCAAAVAAGLLSAPAFGQFRDQRNFFLIDPFRPSHPPSPFFGFPREPQRQAPPQRSAEPGPGVAPEESGGTIYGSSEAADKYRPTKATHYVVVIGDSLADQLAQGLADAFVTERPEVAIVKKTRGSSGLVRADFYDWPAQVPELLEQESPSAIVVMVGTNDRQVLRDEKGAYEIRSDRWRELYIARIEALIGELRKKQVPILVTGLPSMQIAYLSADLQYINEVFREQAQRLGFTFVDVWDGFIDENDSFTTYGPALDGQRRRLRMGDGVHFTRVGARKLAHYVERDLIRLFDQGPRALPIPQDGPEVAPSGRPIAGPVLPLTQPAGPVGTLAGGEAPRAGNGDATARQVLLEGSPVAPVGGRADDFRWPRAEVKIARPESASQSVALPTEAEPAATEPASSGSADTPQTRTSRPANGGNAPLPTVISPSNSGQRIISVPDQVQGR